MLYAFFSRRTLRTVALLGSLALAVGRSTPAAAQVEDSTAVSPLDTPDSLASPAPTASPKPAPATGKSVGSMANERLIRQIGGMLEGTYNSAEQAATDKEYQDIRLHIARIWKERLESEGPYYYVEQATASALLKPYRQRVYHLHARHEDGKVELEMYELANPLRFTGQWKQKRPLAQLTPDSLLARDGCSLLVKKDKSVGFVGATAGKACANTQRGAAYTTTELIIAPKQLIFWDRGFNAQDEQVWGAKFGGYVFKKENAYTRLPDEPKK